MFSSIKGMLVYSNLTESKDTAYSANVQYYSRATALKVVNGRLRRIGMDHIFNYEILVVVP